MRRRRSETINAQSYDEFLRLCQAPTIPSKYRARNSLPEANLFAQVTQRRTEHLPDILLQKHSKESAKTPQASASASYWEGMDFDSEGILTPTTTATSLSSVHRKSLDRDLQAAEEQCIREAGAKRVNVMVIGAKGSGRHRFINDLFRADDEDDTADHGIRGAFDLVIKKGGANGDQNLYKFWVKDACYEGYKHLFRSYYKTVSVYIFVYQDNDKGSFECLENSIKEIQEENRGNNYAAYLVARKSDNQQVLYEEGEQLKSKFELQGFFETPFEYDEEEQERVFEALFP